MSDQGKPELDTTELTKLLAGKVSARALIHVALLIDQVKTDALADLAKLQEIRDAYLRADEAGTGGVLLMLAGWEPGERKPALARFIHDVMGRFINGLETSVIASGITGAELEGAKKCCEALAMINAALIETADVSGYVN